MKDSFNIFTLLKNKWMIIDKNKIEILITFKKSIKLTGINYFYWYIMSKMAYNIQLTMIK